MSFGLHSITCCRCKEPFGLHHQTYEVLRRSHQTFHCPFGHPQIFSEGPSEEDKLRRERDRLKQNAAYLESRIANLSAERDAETRRVSAAKGRITRMKNRAASGHCPCCNRVFVDLLSHMKSKHADYEAQPIDLDAPEAEEIAA